MKLARGALNHGLAGLALLLAGVTAGPPSAIAAPSLALPAAAAPVGSPTAFKPPLAFPARGQSAPSQALPQSPPAMLILDRWGRYADELSGDPVVWREQLAAVLSLASPATLARIAQIEPAADVQSRAGDYAAIFAKAVSDVAARMTLESSSEISRKLGEAGSDLVFVPIAPCRIVDTRNAGGAIGAGTTRNFYFYVANMPSYSWSAQGGVAGTALSTCPKSVLSSGGGALGNAAPQAAVATVTAVNTTAAGNFAVWGGAGATPLASVLNWAPGQVVANTTILPAGGRSGTGAGGAVLDFSVNVNGPSGSADVAVDIVGYFVQSAKTMPECYFTGEASANIPQNGPGSVLSPACAAGYAVISGTCKVFTTLGWLVASGKTDRDDVWQCAARASAGSSDILYAAARCCRIPGQ